MKKTLKQLLRWAKGRCFIEISATGWTEVSTFGELCNVYSRNTLYKALQAAYRAETDKEK